MRTLFGITFSLCYVQAFLSFCLQNPLYSHSSPLSGPQLSNHMMEWVTQKKSILPHLSYLDFFKDLIPDAKAVNSYFLILSSIFASLSPAFHSPNRPLTKPHDRVVHVERVLHITVHEARGVHERHQGEFLLFARGDLRVEVVGHACGEGETRSRERTSSVCSWRSPC